MGEFPDEWAALYKSSIKKGLQHFAAAPWKSSYFVLGNFC